MPFVEKFFHERHVGQNSLTSIVEQRIKEQGSITFEAYMDLALNGGVAKDGAYFPGYYSGDKVSIGYSDNNPSEKKGDFTTSPECSPIFGFCVAKQILEMREIMGKPLDFTIAEMGAGNGTLTYDVIHGLRYLDPKAAEAINYLIIEQSPSLIARQKEKLKDLPVRFLHESATDIKMELTGVFFSNELVDALPTQVVRRNKKNWGQLYIGKGSSDRFSEIWGEPQDKVMEHVQKYTGKVKPGDYIPVNLNAKRWMKNVAASLKRGYVITVDYDCSGHKPLRAYGDSRDKQMIGGYMDKKRLGEFDVTSDVHFQALADTGRENGLLVVGDNTQGGFLQGTEYHKIRDEILLIPGYKEIIGGRKYCFFRTHKLITDFAGMRVMIQAKGVDTSRPLSGAVHVYHDLEAKEKKDFVPLVNPC